MNVMSHGVPAWEDVKGIGIVVPSSTLMVNQTLANEINRLLWWPVLIRQITKSEGHDPFVFST